LENPEYEFQPVDIKTFIEHPYYLNLNEYCWPEVKKDLIAFYDSDFPTAVLDEAIGAGKSTFSSIVATYEAYRMLCLKDPVKHFKLMPKSKIAFMNMSLNAQNAKDIVFGDILARIDDCQWFKDNAPRNERKRSVIEFPHKHVYIIPGNSKETFPAGYNIFSAIIDEAAWYIEKKNMQGKITSVAEEIFNSMKRRISSRFGKFGKIVLISNPRYVDDFIEKKMKEAKTDKTIFARRRALWDVKPDLKEARMIKIGYNNRKFKIPEIFVKDFRLNPELFMRDLMALPVEALEPYIKDWATVENAYKSMKIRNIWKQGYLLTDELDRYGGPCFIHIDLSLNKDECGFAMVTKYRNLVIALCIAQLLPNKKKEIEFEKVREMVYTLKRKGFNIKKVSLDGWQSIDTIQQLKRKQFDAEILSIDRNLAPYDTLKGLLNEGRFKMPQFQPALNELQRLELVDGKRVDHPAGSDKGITDAIAGACYWAAGNEVNEMAIYSPTMTGRIIKKPHPDDEEVLIIN